MLGAQARMPALPAKALSLQPRDARNIRDGETVINTVFN